MDKTLYSELFENLSSHCAGIGGVDLSGVWVEFTEMTADTENVVLNSITRGYSVRNNKFYFGSGVYVQRIDLNLTNISMNETINNSIKV